MLSTIYPVYAVYICTHTHMVLIMSRTYMIINAFTTTGFLVEWGNSIKFSSNAASRRKRCKISNMAQRHKSCVMLREWRASTGHMHFCGHELCLSQADSYIFLYFAPPAVVNFHILEVHGLIFPNWVLIFV